VQHAHEAVALGHATQGLHHQHLVVGGDVGLLEDRRHLELPRGDLVVTGLHGHAEAVELPLHLAHEREHARGDGAEVVVLHLLALRGLGAEEGAAAGEQVGALVEQVAVDEEVLLLAAQRGHHAVDLIARAEEAQHPHGLRGEGLHRAQQRGLGVEGLALPRHEGRGDHQGHEALGAHQERRARGVPRGVAAGLEGRAQAARGEARRVGLGLHQLAARKREHHVPGAVGVGEGVVLLGRRAREGLEPVGVVRGALLDGPVLHGRGDDVGGLVVEALTALDGAHQGLEDLLGEPSPHLVHAEHVGGEDLVDAGGLRSGGAVFPVEGGDDGVVARMGGGHGARHGAATAAGSQRTTR